VWVCTGAIGLYLALTGKRLSRPADLLFTGLGTHYIRAERLEQFKASLGNEVLQRASTKAVDLSSLEPKIQRFQVALARCL